jgi:integrase
MPDILVDALRAHRQVQLELRLQLGLGKLSGDDLLFPNLEGGLTSPQQLSGQWFVFAKSIGMGDVTFHALRHTHVAQLIDACIDVMTIAKRLGHARASTTINHYGHLFRNTDEKAAAAINNAIKGC